MLRLLVGLLVAANLAFWGWTQPGIAQALGLPSGSEREPLRLARQQQPEAIRVLPARASASAASAADGSAPASEAGPAGDGASAPGLPACLEPPALSAGQLALAVRSLQQAGVAAGAWVEMRRDLPGQWVVYMGRFADREQLQRKATELSSLALSYEQILSGELAPGLQLGEFDSAAQAQARLNQLQGRGVRTARVLTTQPPSQELRLRADRLTDEAMSRLQQPAASAPASAPSEIRWSACSP